MARLVCTPRRITWLRGGRAPSVARRCHVRLAVSWPRRCPPDGAVLGAIEQSINNPLTNDGALLGAPNIHHPSSRHIANSAPIYANSPYKHRRPSKHAAPPAAPSLADQQANCPSRLLLRTIVASREPSFPSNVRAVPLHAPSAAANACRQQLHLHAAGGQRGAGIRARPSSPPRPVPSTRLCDLPSRAATRRGGAWADWRRSRPYLGWTCGRGSRGP